MLNSVDINDLIDALIKSGVLCQYRSQKNQQRYMFLYWVYIKILHILSNTITFFYYFWYYLIEKFCWKNLLSMKFGIKNI